MDEKLTNKLEKIFENINSWLLFAEAKHGVLIGGILVLISCLKDIPHNNFVIIGLGLSLIISLISFFPIIRFMPKLQMNTRNNNLCFYSDIANFTTKEEYLSAVLLKYFLSENLDNINKYNFDLSEEILINSKITSNKYVLFKFSLLFFIIALITIFLFYLRICFKA